MQAQSCFDDGGGGKDQDLVSGGRAVAELSLFTATSAKTKQST